MAFVCTSSIPSIFNRGAALKRRCPSGRKSGLLWFWNNNCKGAPFGGRLYRLSILLMRVTDLVQFLSSEKLIWMLIFVYFTWLLTKKKWIIFSRKLSVTIIWCKTNRLSRSCIHIKKHKKARFIILNSTTTSEFRDGYCLYCSKLLLHVY